MLTRRGFLAGSASSIVAACARPPRGPTLLATVPSVTHGVQAGATGRGAAIVWARASEPSRMIVEWDTTPRFERPTAIAGPVVGPETDHTGKVELTGLPDGQTIAYRVKFVREAARGDGAWVSGKLVRTRADRLRVAWTGDTCGQGFGRNPEWGGLRGYAAIRAAQPDLFIHSGDLIYADNPILPELALPDGRIWRNISHERIARPAESLEDFRARYAYNLEDEHVRALSADVPSIMQWDDHEVRNNWWPGQQLDDPRYRSERDASRLAERVRRAMLEWCPIPAGPIHRVVPCGPLLDVFVLDCRSFRTPNDRGDAREPTRAMLGAAQATWLVDALAASRARWKLIACDQPIALVIPDDGGAVEGFAAGTPPALGRELELAGVLAGIKRRGVKNVAWVTADVHYAAAHRFDPARAQVANFEPFWEFIAGPIHAGTFGAQPIDPTFGPEVVFQWVPPDGQQNLAPWDGMQSFGMIDVTHEALVVSLCGLDGQARYRVEIPHVA